MNGALHLRRHGRSRLAERDVDGERGLGALADCRIPHTCKVPVDVLVRRRERELVEQEAQHDLYGNGDRALSITALCGTE